MSHSESKLARHYEVLIKLAKSESMRTGDLASSLREITEAASHTLDIARVNIWLFDEGRTKISCIDHYELASGEHSSGMELCAVDYPLYFEALDEERAIVANDAHSDPRTREFSKGYLDKLGITSMMDAPLRARGTVIGIVCHEHIGPARVWTQEEQLFAGSLADLAALALESSERRQAEHALQQSEIRTRAILTNALDAIVTIDEHSVIKDWNPRAEIVFGWSRDEALGKTLYDTVIPVRDHARHREGMANFLRTGEGPMLNRRIELSAVDKAGRKFPIELSVSPLRFGNAWMFSAFIRDITARVRAEQEIHELNANLEERVYERTDQLKTAVVQKEQLLEQLRTNSSDLIDKLGELEHKSEIIQKDLERAQVIQRALLPSHPPRLDSVHVDALYRPGMNVGGDLYDIARLSDGRIALYVADATGHGVSAAMLSVLFKQRLEMCDQEGCTLDPAEVLTRVNDQLCADVLNPGMFLTAAYVVVDPKTLQLRAAAAGHTPMLLLRENGELHLLERTGPGLGLGKTPRFTEHQVQLQPGDRFILFTDGLIEGIESQGTEGLRELITSAMTGDDLDGPARLRKLYQGAVERARATANGEGADDVTLLMLEARSGPSHLDNDPELMQASAEQPPPVPSQAAAPRPQGNEMRIAENGLETYLNLRGRGTWTLADSFRLLATNARTAGRALTIDLSDCTGLDSTFLGTLHEIVTMDATGEVSLRGPNQVVRGLFAELGLEAVLASIRTDEFVAPAEQVLVPETPSTRESHRLLLRAHETLSEISDENRERFSGVVEALRADLDDSEGK